MTERRPGGDGAATGPHAQMTIVLRLAWVVIVISVAILLVFGPLRLVETLRTPSPTDAFGARYAAHPWITVLHVIPGLAFLVLAPLQLVARLRDARPGLHRVLGRALVACAAVSGVTALVASVRFPAFGGASTQAATAVFGTLFLVSLVQGVRAIRARDVARHREWMLRVLALALGVASIRVVIALLTRVGGLDFEQVFGIAFWLGLGLNALAAEAWIRLTRRKNLAR